MTIGLLTHSITTKSPCATNHGQSANRGPCPGPVPVLAHGSSVPPKIPFWQSKIKQKSVAAAADSSAKLLQPVPGPARRYPPPAANVTNAIALRADNRIKISFQHWRFENAREQSILRCALRPSWTAEPIFRRRRRVRRLQPAGSIALPKSPDNPAPAG